MRDERDWGQFHTAGEPREEHRIEAGELLECFQWGRRCSAARVTEELADVLTYCLLLADKLGVDADQIVLDKLEVTRAKYPAEIARAEHEV